MLRSPHGILVAISLSTIAHAGDMRGGTDVDLKESAADFVRLFDETCFQNRDRLETLRMLATQRGWTEHPGPFPYRDANSTTQIVWGFQQNGVIYQLYLSIYDNSAPAFTCGLMSVALDKTVLARFMQDRFEMRIVRTATVAEQDITVLELNDDPGLLISCATATPPPVLVGQCALVRPIRKDGFGAPRSHHFGEAITTHSALTAEAVWEG